MIVVIRHVGGARMIGETHHVDGNSIDVVFRPQSGGEMAMARSRFSLTHGFGEKKGKRLANSEHRRLARLGLQNAAQVNQTNAALAWSEERCTCAGREPSSVESIRRSAGAA